MQQKPLSTNLIDNVHLFPVSNLSEDSYDYVFGGRRETPPVTSSIKLTSPPIRIRTDGKIHYLYLTQKLLKFFSPLKNKI